MNSVQVLFASCARELIPAVAGRMMQLHPELPMIVVSEFAPPEGEWIQFHILRSAGENLEFIRARLGGRDVRIAAIVLDPELPFREFRRLAFRFAPAARVVIFDRSLESFSLQVRDAPAIARHIVGRTREIVRPAINKWTRRISHPSALKRPLFYRLALAAGATTAWLKRRAPGRRIELGPELPDGITVVIPSRNGRVLLERCLPHVAGAANEVIVVDNGSNDGTVGFLQSHYRGVIVEHSAEPLSFARAVNRGIEKARYSHVCLLNNDMVVEAGFLKELRTAFNRVPDLFCATAQIFMPEGQRREETGKAVMPLKREPGEFPLRCEVPIEGETFTYVLYGSGGASLYDVRKLRALGGMSSAFNPAYVEDLDLGFNGWRLGWPTVFVAAARVLHHHRSTTSRYYSEAQLRILIERHFLRFLARSVTDPSLFRELWREAIWRINLDCNHRPETVEALQAASLAPAWMEPRPPASIPERDILAIGSGALAAFPGHAPRGRPAVLVVSPYTPYPLSHGGAVRMFNLMRRAAADYDQVLVCFVDELQPVPPELAAICVEVVYVRRYGTHALPSTERPDVVEEFDSPVMHAVLRQTVRKWRPAIAQLEFTQMAQYAGDCAPARTVLVEHDITVDLYAQLLAQRDDWETRRQHDRWLRFEHDAWGTVDRVVTMSEKDRRAVGRAHTVTIPNGVDIQRFQPAPEPPDPARILFIGSFAHLPNVLAIDYFLRESWPLLQPLRPALHIIAGSRPEYFLDRYKDRVRPGLDEPGIELEAFVADVRPAYRRAAVVIAPLLASAGTNIKIMEAMAMGKAIVSTPAGINGLDELEHGRDVIVVKDGEAMAGAIAGLLNDPELRRGLETRARETAVARYDWDVIAARQDALYRQVLAAAVPNSAPHK